METLVIPGVRHENTANDRFLVWLGDRHSTCPLVGKLVHGIRLRGPVEEAWLEVGGQRIVRLEPDADNALRFALEGAPLDVGCAYHNVGVDVRAVRTNVREGVESRVVEDRDAAPVSVWDPVREEAVQMQPVKTVAVAVDAFTCEVPDIEFLVGPNADDPTGMGTAETLVWERVTIDADADPFDTVRSWHEHRVKALGAGYETVDGKPLDSLKDSWAGAVVLKCRNLIRKMSGMAGRAYA